MKEVWKMSTKELERLQILSRVLEGRCSQVVAAKQMGISDRQVRNLLSTLKKEGPKGVASKKRGRLKNHCLPLEYKKEVLAIVEQQYKDFGPTLACEYLEREHNLKVSRETLRKWMMEKGLWRACVKKTRLRPLRERRGLFGELVQIDGSHHHWFEDRGEPCVLMVAIDDATSMITALHFCKEETLNDYYHTCKKHFTSYGIPLAFYGDKCSVLVPRQVNHPNHCTQFQKALTELGCKLFLAGSPQAKGRVERVNRTLQDRLVKMLRMRGVSTIEEGNLVLEEYRQQHNQSFSKRPSDPTKDAHRPLEGICLDKILCHRSIRTLSKDHVVQFRNTFFHISSQESRLHKGAKIEIRECLSGEIKAFYQGKAVNIQPLSEVPAPVLDKKELQIWRSKRIYIPPKTHPYKRSYRKKAA